MDTPYKIKIIYSKRFDKYVLHVIISKNVNFLKITNDK